MPSFLWLTSLSQFVSKNFIRAYICFRLMSSTLSGGLYLLITRMIFMTIVIQLSNETRSLSISTINKSFVFVEKHSQLVKSWLMRHVKPENIIEWKTYHNTIEKSLEKQNNLINLIIRKNREWKRRKLKQAAPKQRYCSWTYNDAAAITRLKPCWHVNRGLKASLVCDRRRTSQKNNQIR